MSPWAERGPVGSRRIRYDPANPARISLAVGFDAVSVAAPLIWRSPPSPPASPPCWGSGSPAERGQIQRRPSRGAPSAGPSSQSEHGEPWRTGSKGSSRWTVRVGAPLAGVAPNQMWSGFPARSLGYRTMIQ